jgi:hypothetical protein
MFPLCKYNVEKLESFLDCLRQPEQSHGSRLASPTSMEKPDLKRVLLRLCEVRIAHRSSVESQARYRIAGSSDGCFNH